jgi:hypothetical protein
LSENFKGVEYIESISVDGRRMWSFKKFGRRVWIAFLWLRIEMRGGTCEYDDEHLGLVKYCKSHDQLSNCQLLKWDFTPWRLLISVFVHQ